MICGSCPFTDGCCYTSLPPKVKCNITNEFHYYDDDCNCVEVMTSKKEQLDFVQKKLSEPGPLVALNYDGPKAPSVSFSGEEVARAYDNLLKTSTEGADASISINPVFEQRTFDAKLLEPVYEYCTRCLVCDVEVPVSFLGGGPKICPDCKRTIRFIKEKFKTELESFE
jgi:hypothetical protein